MPTARCKPRRRIRRAQTDPLAVNTPLRPKRQKRVGGHGTHAQTEDDARRIGVRIVHHHPEPDSRHARTARHHGGDGRGRGHRAMAHHWVHPGQCHHDPHHRVLQDRFSTRRLFLASMALFTLGSLLAGLGHTFAMLLAGRLVQAAGAGILMPMTMTVLMIMFPVDKRGSRHGPVRPGHRFRPAIGPTGSGPHRRSGELAHHVLRHHRPVASRHRLGAFPHGGSRGGEQRRGRPRSAFHRLVHPRLRLPALRVPARSAPQASTPHPSSPSSSASSEWFGSSSAKPSSKNPCCASRC